MDQLEVDRKEIAWLARQIPDDETFYAILSEAEPGLRRGVYKEIKPFLNFKVKPFYLINFKRYEQ